MKLFLKFLWVGTADFVSNWVYEHLLSFASNKLCFQLPLEFSILQMAEDFSVKSSVIDIRILAHIF